MFFEIIKRISQDPEMREDPRISAEELKQLLFKAMRLRNSKEHLDLLFKITDVDGNNRIHFYDLQRL